MWYLLEQDLYFDGTWGIDGTMPELDPLALISGASVEAASVPIEVVLSDNSGGGVPDMVFDLFTLVSTRLRHALDAVGVDNVQYLPARVRHPDGRVFEEGYFIANVLGCLAALDNARSRFGSSVGGIPGPLQSFVVNDRQARDVRLFRPYESRILIVIDEVVKDAIEAAGLTGVSLVPTTAWTGTPGQA